MFLLESMDAEISGESGLFSAYGGSAGNTAAKFDLTLGMVDSGGMLRGSFNYSAALFAPQTIESYISTYLVLLEQIGRLGDGRNKVISQINYLSPVGYLEQIEHWNRTSNTYPKHETIHSLFGRQVERTPDAAALVYGGVSLSYSELNVRANRLAHYLVDVHGTGPDDLVVLCLDRSEHMLVAILGVLKAGGAYVPIDPAYPTERITYMLSDTRSRVLLTNERYRENLQKNIAHQGIAVIGLNSTGLEGVLKGYSPYNPDRQSEASNLAYVVYTSGTTGRPKGVMVEHRSFVNLLSYYRTKYFKAGQQINTRSLTNYVFDIWGLEYGVPLLSGGYICISDNNFEAIDASEYDFLQFTPGLLSTIYDQINFNNPALKLFVGGEALPAILLERLLKKQSLKLDCLVNVYGPTETTIWSLDQMNTPTAYNTDIGRPIANTTVYVLDRALNPLPIGAVGELYIGGEGVARGYLNRPELTAERFISNPFLSQEQKAGEGSHRLYRTGDLVRYHFDGNLEYLGRNDFQVKVNGYRIELGEIESVMNNCPGVKQSTVLALKNVHGDSYLVGYYISPEPLSQSALMDRMGKYLPEHMLPLVLMYLKSMPLTPSGKIDRAVLPVPGFMDGSVYRAPETELQKKISLIWGAQLDISPERIGIDDDFFRLGGNSIMAIRLVNQMNKQLAYELKVAELFRYRTIQKLTERQGNTDGKNSMVIPLNDAVDRPELFMVHPGLAGCEVYAPLAQKLSDNYHCYGVDAYNLYHDNKIDSMNKLAEYYLQQIDEVKVSREEEKYSYQLLGWSQGGLIALEIAAILESRGVEDIKVYLLDSMLQVDRPGPISAEMINNLIEKGKLQYQHVEDYESRARSFLLVADALARQPISAKLAFTKVLLFKALRPITEKNLDDNPGAELMFKVPDNHIGQVMLNKDVKVIKMGMANHWDILQYEEELIKGITESQI
jgi:amino acid adenylation domain-containing protein